MEIRDSEHMSKVYAKNYSGKYILARKDAPYLDTPSLEQCASP